jgi:hypothetical protein
MKTLKSICVSGLIAAAAAVNATGQTSGTDINPASLYYQAFLVAPDSMPEADMDYLYSKEGRSQKLPERFGKFAAGYDNEFQLVRQAAQATLPCDWGLDMSTGPATLLPHLARAKAVSIAARFRVMWDLQHGRQADAREDLIAALALGRNVARDGTLISTLVQQAIEAMTCGTVAENFGQFSPETLEQLVAGIDAAPPRRMVAACVPAEKALFQDWLVSRILELQKANPGDDTKVMTGIHQAFATMLDPQQDQPGTALQHNSEATNWWAQVTQAAGGTSEGVAKLVRELEPLDQKLALILALPHGEYETRMEQLKAEVQQSPNPLISTVFPGWERARSRELKILVYLAMVRAAIEYKLHGEAGLQSVIDPCGQGPFAFERFMFEGMDRGLRLKSASTATGTQLVLIFAENQGPPFRVDGPHVGQAVTK